MASNVPNPKPAQLVIFHPSLGEVPQNLIMISIETISFMLAVSFF